LAPAIFLIGGRPAQLVDGVTNNSAETTRPAPPVHDSRRIRIAVSRPLNRKVNRDLWQTKR
jgi:hypothetical protein